jgi:hypothetical protein
MLRLYVSSPCCEAPSSSAVKLNKPLADASRLGANTYCRVACRSQMQTQSDASMFPTPAHPFRVCVSNPKTAEGPSSSLYSASAYLQDAPVGMEC